MRYLQLFSPVLICGSIVIVSHPWVLKDLYYQLTVIIKNVSGRVCTDPFCFHIVLSISKQLYIDNRETKLAMDPPLPFKRGYQQLVQEMPQKRSHCDVMQDAYPVEDVWISFYPPESSPCAASRTESCKIYGLININNISSRKNLRFSKSA